MMFLISEVHPFDDGNGRLARLAMNAELSAAGQHRVLVPHIMRNDYLGGLRRLSCDGEPTRRCRAHRQLPGPARSRVSALTPIGSSARTPRIRTPTAKIG